MKKLIILIFTFSSITGFSQNYKKGFKIKKDWRKRAVSIEPFLSSKKMPEILDYRKEVSGLTPIRHQGNCGSCWAFSTMATMADVIKLRIEKDLDLSEQYLVSCNTEGWGCNGGWYAFDMLKKPGSVYEKDFPYSATDEYCRYDLKYREKIDSWGFVDTDHDVAPVEKMKKALVEYGPLSVAISATGSFMGYTGGVFNYCENDAQVDHAINIVGYNDKEKYWIIRNSWGKKWGENGFGRISYNCNNIGYAAAFITEGANCKPQPKAYAGAERTIRKGEKTRIGYPSNIKQTYTWSPKEGLDDPTKATPIATPTKTTVYTVKVKTKCAIAKHRIEVKVK